MTDAIAIMTAHEVAALLRVHIRTIYKLAEKGMIPGNKIGRSWRFSKNDILGLISDKKRLKLGQVKRSLPEKSND